MKVLRNRQGWRIEGVDAAKRTPTRKEVRLMNKRFALAFAVAFALAALSAGQAFANAVEGLV